MEKEIKKELTAARMNYVKIKLEGLGITLIEETEDYVTFVFKGDLITHWAFSGWHTGKAIKDGRGIERLIKQIQNG